MAGHRTQTRTRLSGNLLIFQGWLIHSRGYTKNTAVVYSSHVNRILQGNVPLSDPAAAFLWVDSFMPPSSKSTALSAWKAYHAYWEKPFDPQSGGSKKALTPVMERFLQHRAKIKTAGEAVEEVRLVHLLLAICPEPETMPLVDLVTLMLDRKPAEVKRLMHARFLWLSFLEVEKKTREHEEKIKALMESPEGQRAQAEFQALIERAAEKRRKNAEEGSKPEPPMDLSWIDNIGGGPAKPTPKTPVAVAVNAPPASSWAWPTQTTPEPPPSKTITTLLTEGPSETANPALEVVPLSTMLDMCEPEEG